MPKYLRKEFRNGRTVYIYPEDGNNAPHTRSDDGSTYNGPKLQRGKGTPATAQKKSSAPLAKQFKGYKRKQAIKKRVNDIVSRLKEKVKSATGAVRKKARKLYWRAKLLARRLKPVKKSQSTSISVSKKPAAKTKKQLNIRKD